VSPKIFEYRASIDAEGALCAEERHRLDPGETWTPEHLVLAALCRCSLSSLRHHAEKAGLDARGAASASGVVTKRERDGRYAFVEIQCGLDVTVEPPPEDPAALTALAERDCFIGASLTAKVEYEWRMNGALVHAGA
jgi:organic hydroperoxide reductase OsmC/OhrA